MDCEICLGYCEVFFVHRFLLIHLGKHAGSLSDENALQVSNSLQSFHRTMNRI